MKNEFRSTIELHSYTCDPAPIGFPSFGCWCRPKAKFCLSHLGFTIGFFTNMNETIKPSVHWSYHVISCYIISPNEKCADSCKSPSFEFGRQSKWLKDIPTSNCTQAPVHHLGSQGDPKFFLFVCWWGLDYHLGIETRNIWWMIGDDRNLPNLLMFIDDYELTHHGNPHGATSKGWHFVGSEIKKFLGEPHL